jgi:hypothetical protein
MGAGDLSAEVVSTIMQDFDFGAVHAHMVERKWTWAGVGVPPLIEIMREARSLLEEVGGHDGYIATGGFKASALSGGGGRLEFLDGRQVIARAEARP